LAALFAALFVADLAADLAADFAALLAADFAAAFAATFATMITPLLGLSGIFGIRRLGFFRPFEIHRSGIPVSRRPRPGPGVSR
jgi:hypothetical protein